MSAVPAQGGHMTLYGSGAKQLNAMPAGDSAEESAGGIKTTARVFVVEDEDFIRELYHDVFESRGITVFSARSGDEAVRIFPTLRFRPDAVIMDHRMPGKDGIETTKELLRMSPGLPIIFSSADENIRQEALEAGAVSFWAKPFPVGLLVNAMLDMLETKKRESGV